MKGYSIFLVVSCIFGSLGGMDCPFSAVTCNLPRMDYPFTGVTHEAYEYFIALKKIEKLVWKHVEEQKSSGQISYLIRRQAKGSDVNSHSFQTMQGLMLVLSNHSVNLTSIISPWGEFELVDWTAHPQMQWSSIIAAIKERLQLTKIEPLNTKKCCEWYMIGAVENKQFSTAVLRKKEDNIPYDEAQEIWRAMEKKYNEKNNP